MVKIRSVRPTDKAFWYSLDRHLPEQEFGRKVDEKRGYVLLNGEMPVGILRYNLFWDNTPFCTMLYIAPEHQRKGYGKQLMEYWENQMRDQGYQMVLTSTQVDEDAQHFYRKLGYKDCGSLLTEGQPMEMFMSKIL